MKRASRKNQPAPKAGARRPKEEASQAAPGASIPRKTTLRDLFGIDPRSLAVFRVAIGALLLVDLAVRATDLTGMYTDEGMFPRGVICSLATSLWNWSFHFGGGSFGYQAVLFALAGLLGLAMLTGFQTRLAVIGSWLMLVSLHHRAPPILSGAENLLRVLLFWAMFLPLGRAWSVDAWLAMRRGGALPYDPRAQVVSVASAAILLQMAMMYLFSAMFKSNAVWFQGEALGGILAHDFYASPLSGMLLGFHGLLKVMTWVIFGLEWAAPFLLIFSARKTAVRLATLVVLAAMHIGIGLFLEVGLFSYVSMAGLALFVPKEFWERFAFARSPEGRAHVPEKLSRGYLAAQGACAVAFLYVLAVNFNSLPSRPMADLSPERWRLFSRGLGLSQMWGMFGSIPSMDGWYVARAKLMDGTEVDLLRDGAAVDWQKPRYPARMYPNYYWQKLFREMAYDDEQGFQRLRRPVADYLCRDWNARNGADKQVVEFEFVYCAVDKAEATPGVVAQVYRERLLHVDRDER